MFQVQCVENTETGKLGEIVNRVREYKIIESIEAVHYLRWMLNNHYHYVVVDSDNDEVVYRTDRQLSINIY